jgi:hypothetical protein
MQSRSHERSRRFCVGGAARVAGVAAGTLMLATLSACDATPSAGSGEVSSTVSTQQSRSTPPVTTPDPAHALVHESNPTPTPAATTCSNTAGNDVCVAGADLSGRGKRGAVSCGATTVKGYSSEIRTSGTVSGKPFTISVYFTPTGIPVATLALLDQRGVPISRGGGGTRQGVSGKPGVGVSLHGATFVATGGLTDAVWAELPCH